MARSEEELNLSTLKPAQKRKARKRVGRGLASGKGRYSGRGIKGQKARSGSHNMRPGFEGGQMPIYMRLGKLRGNTSKDAMPIGPFRTYMQPVNLRDLDRFDAGAEVTPESLVEIGLLKNTKTDVKITEKILFAFGKATIDEKSNDLIDEIAGVVIDNPQIEYIEVAGHADKIGTDGFNVNLTRQRAHAVHAPALVGLHRDRAEQPRQLAGRGAAQQVHLEVAFLRMHVAERAHGVGFAGGVDGHRAEGVALQGGFRRQAGQAHCAIQRRQARAQRPPRRQRDDQHHQEREPERRGLLLLVGVAGVARSCRQVRGWRNSHFHDSSPRLAGALLPGSVWAVGGWPSQCSLPASGSYHATGER